MFAFKWKAKEWAYYTFYLREKRDNRKYYYLK